METETVSENLSVLEDIGQFINRRNGYAAEQLAVLIRDRINANELKAGQRFPATSEMTKLLGVSTHTIQRAMLSLESEGLIEGAPGKGRFVSSKAGQDKDSRRSVQIGVMNAFSFEANAFPGDELRVVSVKGVLSEVSKQNANAVIMPYGLLQQEPSSLLDSFKDFDGSGLVWLYPSSSHWRLINELEKNEIPVVVTSRAHLGYNIACVEGDYEDGGYTIGRHLADSQAGEVVVFADKGKSEHSLSPLPESMNPLGVTQGIRKGFAVSGSAHNPGCSTQPINAQDGMFPKPVLDRMDELNDGDGVVFLNSFHLYSAIKHYKDEAIRNLSRLNVIVVANQHLISKFAPYQGQFDMHILQDPLAEIARIAVQKLSTLIDGSLQRTKTLVKADFLHFSEIENFD